MSEDETPTSFQHAIWQTHGARSQLLTREHVVEKFEGETVWEGEVLVFALKDHPTAHFCYAWEVDGQVTTVLHAGPVDSPVAAVRASILAEESDGEPRIISGCSVLKAAPAREHSRYEVVICQLPDVKKGEQPRTRSATTGVPRYVVWYIDDKGNPTDGRYYKEREDAQSEFDRRTQSIPL